MAGFGSGEKDDSVKVGIEGKTGVESRMMQSEAEQNSGVKSCFRSASRASLSSKETSENGEEDREGIWVGSKVRFESYVIAGSCREEAGGSSTGKKESVSR